MGNLHFDIDPGSLSAIYFIVLEVFMLAVVDVVLIHVVSAMYYHRIKKGIPLEVKSAEIPGVATSLVGRVFSFPNLFAYVIKFTLLAFILLMDLNIKSELVYTKSELSLTGKFIFNASNAKWPYFEENNQPMHRVVERQYGLLQNCRVVAKDGSNITFYALACNLESDLSFDDELQPADSPYVYINHSSIHCLADGQVDHGDAIVSATVIGCSQLQTTQCMNETVITRDAVLSDDPSEPVTVTLRDSLSIFQGDFIIRNFDDVASSIWPEYISPLLTCLRVQAGVGYWKHNYESCLVISSVNGNDTLVERWEYNNTEKIMIRRFPGPVFKGIIEIGIYQKTAILYRLLTPFNWETFSAEVVALGSIYQMESLNIISLDNATPITTVPTYSVVLGVMLVAAACIAHVVVRCTISRGDKPRPLLNTIDGLSSVAREESEPTGRSFEAGRHTVIGFSRRSGITDHFGPLTTRDMPIFRERGVLIE